MPKLALSAWVRRREGSPREHLHSWITDWRARTPCSQPRSLHSISMESVGWGMRPKLLHKQKESQQLQASEISPMWLQVLAGSGVGAWHFCSSAEHSYS